MTLLYVRLMHITSFVSSMSLYLCFFFLLFLRVSVSFSLSCSISRCTLSKTSTMQRRHPQPTSRPPLSICRASFSSLPILLYLVHQASLIFDITISFCLHHITSQMMTLYLESKYLKLDIECEKFLSDS